MKKIFIALVGLFLLNEIAQLFTGWANIDWMNIAGFIIVGCIAVILDKEEAKE